MFFDAIDKVPRGLIACVFDGTDRLQHTFSRDIDERHPARPDQDVLDSRNVIEDLYRRMDDLVGKTMAKCRDKNTLLMVISDHGFGPFRRGVDLNRWLADNGYLTLHDGRGDKEHLAGVDWSPHTRLRDRTGRNLYRYQGRMRSKASSARSGEADRLREEIAERLNGADRPGEPGQRRQARLYRLEVLQGSVSSENGPDLIVGYQRGYRVSWETAIGRTTKDVFHDNAKAWSGDHCVEFWRSCPGSSSAIASWRTKILALSTSAPPCSRCSARLFPTTWTARHCPWRMPERRTPSGTRSGPGTGGLIELKIDLPESAEARGVEKLGFTRDRRAGSRRVFL